MAVSTEKLGLEIALEGWQQFKSQMGEADKEVHGLGKAWEGLSGVAGTAASALGTVASVGLAAVAAGALAAVSGVTALAIEIGKLTLAAAPLEGIGKAFEVMSEDAGLALSDLHGASEGTISDFELMRLANVALTGAGGDLSQEFGQHLPDLLRIARSAARATGQDVGFLFQSLVTGIKRTSPMLIDNTGLQLKLGKANQTLADNLGKSVEELTSEEQQIAILNATLAAGQNMVDAFGGGSLTAAERLAQMQANVQNLKDQIGVAFLPVLNALLEPLNEIASAVGPLFIEWANNLSTALLPLVNAVLEFAKGVGLFLTEGDAFNDFFANLAQQFPELAPLLGSFMNLLDRLSGWWDEHGDEITAAVDTMFGAMSEDMMTLLSEEILPFLIQKLDEFSLWWDEHGDEIAQAIEDLATKHIPNLWSSFLNFWQIVEPILSGLANVFMLTVQLIAQIIEGDWDSVWRTAVGILAECINAMLLAIEGFFNWIAKEIMGTTMADIRQQWQDNWDMAAIILQTWVNDTGVAIASFFADLIYNFDTYWAQAQKIVADFTNDALMLIVNLFKAIYKEINDALGRFKDKITGFVNDVLLKLTEFHDYIREYVIQVIKELAEKIEDKLFGVFKVLLETWLIPIRSAFGAIRNAIKSVIEWIGRMVDVLGDIQIPSALLPGSPTPFEMGLRGIRKELDSLARMQLPAFKAALDMGAIDPVGIAAAGSRGNGRSSVMNVTNNFNLTTQSTTRPGGLAAEFDAMAFMGAR